MVHSLLCFIQQYVNKGYHFQGQYHWLVIKETDNSKFAVNMNILVFKFRIKHNSIRYYTNFGALYLSMSIFCYFILAADWN